MIVIDLETYDPTLTTKGTDAFCRRTGGYVFMCGLYFTNRDGEGSTHSLPWDDNTKNKVRDLLDDGNHWLGANLKYDLNWLLAEGVLEPRHLHNNHFHDTHINAPLIDETKLPNQYSLDAMCKEYGLATKPIEDLLRAAAEMGLYGTEKKIRGMLHQLPWGVVAAYNQHDLVATWEVYCKQRLQLESLGLLKTHNDFPYSVVELEEKLLPVLCLMEQKGVQVDIKAAEELYKNIYAHIDETKELLRQANNGEEVPLAASKALEKFILDRGHVLPETKASKPGKERYSTAEGVLLQVAKKDPLIKELMMARKAEKIAKDFVKKAILESHHNGKIHCNINQLVSRKEGTNQSQGVRYGRLSASKPNLMQVPKRDSVEFEDIGGLGTAMRALFVAEPGYEFMSADFSGQEPRWITHYAEKWGCVGAEKAGAAFRENPKLDYHEMVCEIAFPDTPKEISRPWAKIINLGRGYEMGKGLLTEQLALRGVDPTNAERILREYEWNFPHISASSKVANAVACQNGYVRTVSGRRASFNGWAPVRKGAGPVLPYDTAYQKYVIEMRMPIERAYTYRAFNRIIQGSAADQTKLAMVVLFYEHGIVPSMQIHDELVDCQATMEKATIYKKVMENCVKLTVPCLTEIKLGPSWAEGVKLDFVAV